MLKVSLSTHHHHIDIYKKEMTTLYAVHNEVRLAFKHCARRQSIFKVERRTLTISSPLRARNRGTHGAVTASPSEKKLKDIANLPETPNPSAPKSGDRKSGRSHTTQLVPRISKAGTLEHPPRSEVPARLLPKAQISPDLTLSPKERLQIEYETRRPPKVLGKPGAQGVIYEGQTTTLTFYSLQRTPVNLSWWSRIYQLHSSSTSHNNVCSCIWSHNYGSSILSL